jgi:choline kinase
MKAIILAAGVSSRLYPLTLDKPKCLLEIGGKKIIDRQIEAIRSTGIADILVVVGYQKEALIAEIGNKVRYREYQDYATTNNLHTLWSVRDELDDDFMCFFSDVLFTSDVIAEVVECAEDFCLIIDTSRILKGTMRVRLENGRLIGIGNQISVEAASGNFIGIAGFSRKGAGQLLTQMERMLVGHENDYYTIAINELAMRGVNIGYVEVGYRKWTEIDNEADLDDARKNHAFWEG